MGRRRGDAGGVLGLEGESRRYRRPPADILLAEAEYVLGYSTGVLAGGRVVWGVGPRAVFLDDRRCGGRSECPHRLQVLDDGVQLLPGDLGVPPVPGGRHSFLDGQVEELAAVAGAHLPDHLAGRGGQPALRRPDGRPAPVGPYEGQDVLEALDAAGLAPLGVLRAVLEQFLEDPDAPRTPQIAVAPGCAADLLREAPALPALGPGELRCAGRQTLL